MRKMRILITTLAAVALAAGGTAAGATLAGSPVDNNGVIHGCWTTTATNGGSHAFVLRNAGTTCPTGTTAISWNKTGPRGPQGPAGPSTAGPNGLDLNIAFSAPSPNVAQADCPADHPYVVGGGGQASGGSLSQSVPLLNGGGWEVVGVGAGDVTAYAVCAK